MPEKKPTYEEASSFVHEICGKSDFAESFVPGKSSEGRDIVFARITDASVPDEDKQVALITGGTHGSEETGRASSMAFLEWLALNEGAAETRRNQIIYLTTCLNPDGCIQDIYHNADDVNIYASFHSGRMDSASVEGAVVRDLVLEHKPEICIDVHGLAGGGMNDTTYLHEGFPSNLNLQYSHFMGRTALELAEAAGIPQSEPQMHGRYRGTDPIPYIAWAHERHNSLSFTVETTENYYPLEYTSRSGLAKLKGLTQWGNRVNHTLPWPGYPVDIISGSSMSAIMPLGNTAAERRISRAEIFQAIHGMPHFKRLHADGGANNCQLTLTVAKTFETVPAGFAAMGRLIKEAEIHEIRVQGREVNPNDCLTWDDDCSRFIKVDVNLPLEIGEYTVDILYNKPF